MELEMATILLRPVVGSIAATPVVAAAGTFDRAPLTTIFGGSLVPQGRIVTAGRIALNNVTNEFCSAIGKAGACKRES